MRIVRTGRKPKWSTSPQNLSEVQPGLVVLIAVRVCAFLGGPVKGKRDTVLCRPFDLVKREELFIGDLVIAHCERVAVYEGSDE